MRVIAEDPAYRRIRAAEVGAVRLKSDKLTVRAEAMIIRDGQLITKVRFPHSLLPLAAGSAALIDFAVGLSLLLVVMIVSGVAWIFSIRSEFRISGE